MFKEEVKKILKDVGDIYFIEKERPTYFDAALRVNNEKFEIKITKNIETLKKDKFEKIFKGATSLGAKPIIISKKGKTLLKDGVVYRRGKTFVMNENTFLKIINNEEIILADRGGEKVPIKNLEGILKEKNMTKEELAKRIGVSTEMIRRYAKKLSFPTLEIAIKMKTILGEEIIDKNALIEEKEDEKVVYIGSAPYEIVMKDKKPIMLSLRKDEKRKKNLEGISSVFDVDYEFVE